MKKHELYNYVDIIKETEKAVCINNKELTEDLEKILNFNINLPREYRMKFNGAKFWIPKSQIEIKNNQIVAITKWLYNQLIRYVDCPLCLKEEAKRLKEEYYNSIIEKRITEETRINNLINKGAN